MEDEQSGQSQDQCCCQSEMGETERSKGISETGQESQTEDECSGQSQTLSQNENDLGQEKRQEVQITGGFGSVRVSTKGNSN